MQTTNKKLTTLITITLITTIILTTITTPTTQAIKLTNTYKNQLTNQQCTDQPTECKPTKTNTTTQKQEPTKKTNQNNNTEPTTQKPTKKNQNTNQQQTTNQTCTDTDNGINPNQQGTTTTNNQTQTDTCTNNNQLTEYYCNTQEATPTNYKINPQTKNIQIQYQGQPNTTYQIQTTTDLTNWTTQTTITTNQNGTATYEDPTTQQNPYKFYKATTTTIQQTTINCPNGCQNGQCNPQPYCPGYQTIIKQKTTTQNTPQPTPQTTTQNTPQPTLQNPNTYTGYLEIKITENNQTQYKLKTKNNTYTLTLNPNQLPPNITTTQRQITIKATPNPNNPNNLTTQQITTNQTTTKNQTNTNTNTTGTKNLAIIITKPPNTPNPDTTNLNQTMTQVKKYYEENSYNQTTITWETLGTYEIDNTTYNQGEDAILTKLDPQINYTKYWSIIIADPRTKPPNATLGQTILNTNEGQITIGIINITPEALNKYTDLIAHELGHNFGLGHAGYWDCQNQPIKNDPECTPIEYYNYIDTMGGGATPPYNPQHFNSYFKEKLGWLNNNKIQEITQDGEYTIYPYEQQNNNPIALKIPRKWNDQQQPTDYYYLEYRTPTGYDKDAIQIYQIKGPTITIPGNQPHTKHDAHLISMNPTTYPYNPGINQNQTFQDTTGLTITTLETTPTHTKIKIHINKNACTRNKPTITINPTTITLRTNPQAPPKTYDWEIGYIDLTIKNNDTQGCSNKYLYAENQRINKQTTRIGGIGYEGVPEIPTTPNGTPYIRAQDTIYNNIIIWFTKPDEIETTQTITIYDDQGNTIHQQPITIKRTQLPTPKWPNQDMAVKFTYNGTGDGKYILDKTGKIHRTGKTLYATENTPTLTNSTAKDLKTINDNPGKDIGTAIIFDSKNQIYTAGHYSGKYDLQFANQPTTPHYCDITQALEITTLKTIRGNYPQIILMDEYGYTTTTKGPIPNSQNWKCQNWQGKTDAIRNTPHATDLEITTNPDGTINGYYILSKDGTIYACGQAPIQYTKLTPQPQFTQNQQATAIALQPNKGIIMIDNYGNTYTSGQTTNLGHPNLTKPNAKDIKFKPNYTGYGILDAEGNIYEYNN
jgi:hypothetical protein